MMNHTDEAPIDPASPAREIIPLSAHATGARLRISTSPTRSVRPISLHVKEPDGTAWRVITVTIEGVAHWYGDPPYPACRGNCWIDLEVECPHDHPPTEANPTELRGVIVCEASDLPVAAGDTERDRQWAADFRKPRGARRLSNDEWETTFRGDSFPLHEPMAMTACDGLHPPPICGAMCYADGQYKEPPSIQAQIAAMPLVALIAKLVNCAAVHIKEYEGDVDCAEVRQAFADRLAELGVATLKHAEDCARDRSGLCAAGCTWRAGGPR